MTLGRGLHALYFDYQPAAGHLTECSRHGTDIWEVTKFVHRNLDRTPRETTFRLLCTECGAIHFETLDGEPGSSESSHADRWGIGGRPVRESGLWLWPGPILYAYDKRGPTAFLVTTEKMRPAAPGDVAGVVGWGLGERSNSRIRWHAGIGCTDYGVKEAAPEPFTSRRGAVKWIAAELGIIRGDQ